MRLRINCDFESNIIPKDYRSKIISLFKTGIEKTVPEKYQAFFGSNQRKNYTFSVYLPKPQNKKMEIYLEEKNCIINFSTGNAETGVIFYNAFMQLKNNKIPFSSQNNITIKSVIMDTEKKIIGEKTILKTLSPIVSRNHHKDTYKNWFYSFENEAFESTLKRNMSPFLEEEFGVQVRYDLEKMKITPISMKKVVVYCHDIHIESSVGVFELTAEPYLQKYFLQNGLGTMTGSGFGHLDFA